MGRRKCFRSAALSCSLIVAAVTPAIEDAAPPLPLASILHLGDDRLLLDARGPLRFDPPLPDDPVLAAGEAAARIGSGGLRATIDPGGRAALRRLAQSFENDGRSRFRLVEDDARRPVLQNVAAAGARDVQLHAVAWTIDGRVQDIPEGSGDPATLTIRLAGAGDPPRDAARIFYFATWTEADGSAAAEWVTPASPAPSAARAADCLPDPDGALVTTRLQGCYNNDRQRVEGNRLVYDMMEFQSGEDLNGNGSTNDRILFVARIGGGDATMIDTIEEWAMDGDLVAWLTDERDEKRDRNGDGDAKDRLVYWYRLSTGERGGPFLADWYPRVLEPWVVFGIEEKTLREDCNGDGDRADTIVQVIDVRSGELIHTRSVGHDYRPGRTALFFLTTESEQNEDLDGDGTLDDTVLRWYSLAGDPGPHNTGLKSRFSLDLWSGGGDLVTIALPKLDGRTWMAALYVGGAEPAVFSTALYTWRVDGDRLIWSDTTAGPCTLRDFAAGTTRVVDVPGSPEVLQGRHLVWEIDGGWEQRLGYHDLEGGQTREIGWTHWNDFDYDASVSERFISWHNDVATECYARKAPWMEYHRIADAATERAGRVADPWSIGSPGRHVVTWTQPESLSARELDGRPGSRGWLLTYYAPACRNFDDLEAHLELAVSDDPAAKARLLAAARRVRAAWEAGRVRDAAATSCALFRQLTGPDVPHLAPLSRQLVRGCVLSTALALGLVASEGACGIADNCPGVPNPMQDDFDNDGVGGACDVCPEFFDPQQLDSDGDRVGDLCEPLP